MIPVAARIAHAGGRRLAVFRLLNSSRGWDEQHTPVDDVGWALAELADRFGNLPVSLVGHSLGGRAAILAADRPGVRSVVALAPWVYVSDGDRDLSGRRVLIVHGDADRVASPQRSALVAERLRRTAETGYVRVSGGTHSMLRHHETFDRIAADFVAATLLGDEPRHPVRDILAGHDLVEV
jgi:pimeloyl-ACP methyl ester carboxylesterase